MGVEWVVYPQRPIEIFQVAWRQLECLLHELALNVVPPSHYALDLAGRHGTVDACCACRTRSLFCARVTTFSTKFSGTLASASSFASCGGESDGWCQSRKEQGWRVRSRVTNRLLVEHVPLILLHGIWHGNICVGAPSRVDDAGHVLSLYVYEPRIIREYDDTMEPT